MTTYVRPNTPNIAAGLRALLALEPTLEPRNPLVWRVLNLNEVELTTAEHEAAALAFAHFATSLIDGSSVLVERPDGHIDTYPPPATVTRISGDPPEAA